MYYFTKSKAQLASMGSKRARTFCRLNNLPEMEVRVISKNDCNVGACAYYRKGVCFICLELCASMGTETSTRNWNWPGSVIDRTPYGVVCHELGHHVDVHFSDIKGAYTGNFSMDLRETLPYCEPITGYCPNIGEWFAELFRVFVTNPKLLEELRPDFYSCMAHDLEPIPSKHSWVGQLGNDVPDRIITSLKNKGAKL